MGARNASRMGLYKDAIGVCCMPGCESGVGLETHHIRPISKGGRDDYVNYIVLCFHCHRCSRLHSRSEENRLVLLTYKLYRELTILGIDSSGLTEDAENRFRLAMLKSADKNAIAEAKAIEDASDSDKCIVKDCEKTAKCQGYCCNHYMQYHPIRRRKTKSKHKR